MRHALAILAAVTAVSAWASPGRAQGQIGYSDPFFLYYGYFLPRQAAIAAQPKVEDTINAAVASQQSYAQTNRSNLYDPNGGYGRFNPNSTYDRFAPDAGTGAGAGTPNSMVQRMKTTSAVTANASGGGPALYFNRTATYYPGLRTGRGPNRNIAVAGSGVRRSGVSAPSATSGMPAAPR